ncbi:hypothetical protein LXL04_031142 [Taraxacum kok-saghyz]
MARSKGISYGRLIVKNLYTTHISTSSNTQILKDITGCRMGGSQSRRTFCSFSGNQKLPPPTPPPPPPSSNWGKWTAGMVVAIVIPLLQFKEEVDVVMETAEEIIDVIEVAAEAVDMVAEKIVADLPDSSTFRTTMEKIEEVAETVAGKAQKAVDFIDEIQEAEQKLGPIIEPVKQQTQATPSEASKLLSSSEYSKRLPLLPLVIRKQKSAIGFHGHPLHITGTITSSQPRRGFFVYSFQPGNHDDDHHHATSGDSPSSWQQWIVRIITTVIVPSFRRKWTKLLLLAIKDEVDTVVEEAEKIVECVEEAAETVDKVARDVAEHLPEGGRWRNAAMFVEDVAEEVAREAQLVEDLLHDVEEIEEKVELLVESVKDQPKNIHQDLNKNTN